MMNPNNMLDSVIAKPKDPEAPAAVTPETTKEKQARLDAKFEKPATKPLTSAERADIEKQIAQKEAELAAMSVERKKNEESKVISDPKIEIPNLKERVAFNKMGVSPDSSIRDIRVAMEKKDLKSEEAGKKIIFTSMGAGAVALAGIFGTIITAGPGSTAAATALLSAGPIGAGIVGAGATAYFGKKIYDKIQKKGWVSKMQSYIDRANGGQGPTI